MVFRRLSLLLSLALLLFASSAQAGSVRYDLTELLGEHRFDATTFSIFNRAALVDTPFGFYTAQEARLVVEGSVSTGKAHGDGVLRENVEFDLMPLVSLYPSFSSIGAWRDQPTPRSFRIEKLYTDPFVPDVTPQPRIDGYPPISFYVGLSVNPGPGTETPPLFEPVLDTLRLYDGIIIDEPIIANISTAYIIFTGPSIVPEPSSLALLAIGLTALSVRRRRG